MAEIVALCNIAVGIKGKPPRVVIAYCNSPVQDATQGLEAGWKTGVSGSCGIAESDGRQGIFSPALFYCPAEKSGGRESAGKGTDAAASADWREIFSSVVPKVKVLLQFNPISFGPCFADGACYAIFFLIGKYQKTHREQEISFSGRQ